MEQGNDDGTESHKSGETNRGTLPGTRRNQEMMMEQNVTYGTERHKSIKPGNTTQNRKEPENDDGTECHQSREISPRTLPRTRRKQRLGCPCSAARTMKACVRWNGLGCYEISVDCMLCCTCFAWSHVLKMHKISMRLCCHVRSHTKCNTSETAKLCC